MTRKRIAVGDRGRVPFAVVGALLVVTSALFAAGVGRPPQPPEPAVDLAMERTTADARSALRQSVEAAAVAAASDPVVSPADTAYGDVLDNGSAFEDALEIRIYLAARQNFEAIERRHRDVTGRVRLPEPTSPASLERAMQRVRVEGVGSPATKLRVTVRNVTQTADYGDRVVGRRNVTLTVLVDSPVLAVHERVTEFQSRLDAGVGKPGLAQKLTARLYPVAWARGYAQYGGAAIENVISNRHVGLLTNAGVLDVQRSVFGEIDSDGRRGMQHAIARTVLNDAIGRASGPLPGVGSLINQQVAAAARTSERRGIPPIEVNGTDSAAPNETVNVSVGQSAISAFRPYAYGDRAGETVRTRYGPVQTASVGSDGLNRTVESVYSARVRAVSAVESGRDVEPPLPDPPNESVDWSVAEDSTAAFVEEVRGTSSAPPVTVPDGYHRLFEHERVVRARFERTVVWEHGNRTAITDRSVVRSRKVRVAIVCDHSVASHAPDNPIETVHEPGGPFNGTNLADVSDAANESLVARNGGIDRIAVDSVHGQVDNVSHAAVVVGEWPAELPERAYPELVALRREVRGITVAVQRGKVGTYEVNPAATLGAELRNRRAELIDAPATYDTVAERARAELRARYVDRVIASLEARAADRRDRESGFAERIAANGGGSLDLLRRSRGARRIDENRPDGADLEFSVDGAPPYLTMSKVTHDQVAAVENGSSVYPLKAENVNVFSIPYGEATDGVINWLTSQLSGTAQTHLRNGANALGSSEAAVRATGNRTVERSRDRLATEVEGNLGVVRNKTESVLTIHDVGESSADREAIVSAAFGRWNTTRELALAVSSRSVVDAVVTEAREHESTDLSSAMDRDRLRLDLLNAVAASLDSREVTLDGPLVTAATKQVKHAVGNRVENLTATQIEKRFNETIGSIPAGLPLAPVPGYWYATTNVWIVNVHGRYERFAVETPRRTPTPADASLSYVRDGRNVTLDVDGDGSDEILGRADRISFDVRTAVVVVVPAGGTGVGDVDGELQERSPGWSQLTDGVNRSALDQVDPANGRAGNSSGNCVDVSYGERPVAEEFAGNESNEPCLRLGSDSD